MKFSIFVSWSKINSSSEQTEAHRHSVSFERALFFLQWLSVDFPLRTSFITDVKFLVRVADWTNDIFYQSNFVPNLCTFWKKIFMFSPPSLDSTVHDRWNAAEGVLKWTWSCWLQVILLMCVAVFCFFFLCICSFGELNSLGFWKTQWD